MTLLTLDNISFAYGETPILTNINYTFEKGKMYCITGKSGVGKTTLLSILSGLTPPDSGTIQFMDNDIKTINTYTLRSKFIGVIFQGYNLLTKFTAQENVMLSMDIAGMKHVNKKEKALELLQSVGLNKDEANRRVLKLSGGQQQRVAIARAISSNADIIIADEPTGNLDRETQNDILSIFRSLANMGKCIIIVSHSRDVAQSCDESYELKKARRN